VGRSAEPARLLPVPLAGAAALLFPARVLPLVFSLPDVVVVSLSPAPTRLLPPLRREDDAAVLLVLPRRESPGAAEEGADVLRVPPLPPPTVVGRRAGRFCATVVAAGLTRWLLSSTLPQLDRVSLSGLVPSGLVGHAVIDPVRDMVPRDLWPASERGDGGWSNSGVPVLTFTELPISLF